jgi:hypothetical protein
VSKGAPRQRCMANAKDGTRCGRWVTDGSNPALCHKHRSNAPTVGVIPPDDEIDEVKILKKLARDANPQVRLRAVDLLLSLKSKEPSLSQTRQLGVDIARLTTSERSRLEQLLLEIRAVREEIWERDPIQRPSWAVMPSVPAIEWESQPVTTTPAPMKPQEADVIDTPSAEASSGLSPLLWPEVGLFTQGGVVTHACGDAHAQAILDGTIPLDEARAAHEAAQRDGKGIKRASLFKGAKK